MNRLAMRGWLFLIVGILTLGCNGNKEPTPVDVKGTVLCDDKPLDDGRVIWVGAAGAVPKEVAIVNGKFELKVAPGKYNVQFYAYAKVEQKADGRPGAEGFRPSLIPDRFGTDSTDTREVTATGPNEFEFKISKMK